MVELKIEPRDGSGTGKFDHVQVSAVPEVRSSAWVALGLLAFGGWARGRRAARA